jgi:hypothetical protein
MQNGRVAMRLSLLISLSLLVGACAKAPPATKAASESATAAKAAAAPTEEKLDAKKPRMGEAAVYVDGKSVGVMRVPELPLGLKAHELPQGRRYFMGEYLTALGVDVAKLKGLQAYGGARIAVMDGDEVRRIQNGLHISFTRGDSGKPRLIWSVVHPRVNTTIDMVSSLCVYVEKEPPVLKDHELFYADGTKVEGVPYAPHEISKGTRVYLDGKLVATVKRKEIPSSIQSGGDVEHPSYSLAGWLANAGVDATGAKTVDFLSGDDLIAHMDSKDWDAQKKEFAFTLPRHNQGQVAIAAGSAKSAKVSALQIFIKQKAPDRTLVAAADISDDDRAGTKGGGGGGGSDDEL